MRHLDEDTLDAWAHAMLDGPPAAAAAAHLAICADCMAKIRVRQREVQLLRGHLRRNRRGSFPMKVGVAAAVLVALFAWMWMRGASDDQSGGEISDVGQGIYRLSDGTEIVGSSAPRVEGWRHTSLVPGDYYLDVTSAAGAPFRVHTDIGEIRVLGTRFRVEYEEREVNGTVVAVLAVTVIGGAVVLLNNAGSETVLPGERGEVVGEQAPVVNRSSDASAPQLQGESPQARIARLEANLEQAKKEIRSLQNGERAEDPLGAIRLKDLEPAKLRAEFTALLKKTYSGTASEADVARLSAFTRNPEIVGALIADLEARIEANPDDLDARLTLVDVDSARLHASAGSIAERTHLTKRMSSQVDAILKRDPENWGGLYLQAMATSHGRRDAGGQADAVRQFQHLIEVQERGRAEPRHSSAYVQLAVLHLSRNDKAKAAEAIQAGFRFLPGDPKLSAFETRIKGADARER